MIQLIIIGVEFILLIPPPLISSFHAMVVLIILGDAISVVLLKLIPQPLPNIPLISLFSTIAHRKIVGLELKHSIPTPPSKCEKNEFSLIIQLEIIGEEFLQNIPLLPCCKVNPIKTQVESSPLTIQTMLPL